MTPLLMNPLILAGDIGGTKINIACFALEQGLLKPVVEETYHTASFTDLESLLTHFLGTRAGAVAAACFGVAGPIKNGRAESVNIPWKLIDTAVLRRHLLTEKVDLLNDMMAMAYGTMVIPEEKIFALNQGDPSVRGNAALIAAGTGLGEALLHWDKDHWEPSPSEGGHADFAPTTELEIGLLRYLQEIHGRVSYERILSGPGLFNIYRFLRDTGRGEQPDWLAERLAAEDPGAVITEAALTGKSALCEKAVEVFVHVYGAEAGNVALRSLATGGVFIGGGIAPKILPILRQETFLEAFTNKGRLRYLLETIPVRVILDPKVALYGAAYHASLLLRDEV